MRLEVLEDVQCRCEIAMERRRERFEVSGLATAVAETGSRLRLRVASNSWQSPLFPNPELETDSRNDFRTGMKNRALRIC